MPIVVCRTKAENGQIRLVPPPGQKIDGTIPRAAREEYEQQHGKLEANLTLEATLGRGGKVVSLAPGYLPPVAIEDPKLDPAATAKRTQPVPPASADQEAPVTDGFINPYNFVPFLGEPVVHESLGQGGPLGHDAWLNGTYSGRLLVRFTTVTPLLTTELTRNRGELPIFTTRRDHEGRPVVAGSSLKGAIRAIVEQATGSRLGVFDGQTPIVRRMIPAEALDLTMAVVHSHEPSSKTITLTRGLLPVAATHARTVRTVSVSRDHLAGFRSGALVHVWLQLMHHPAEYRNDHTLRKEEYRFWRSVGPVTAASSPEPNAPQRVGKLSAVPGEPLVEAWGHLHITGKSFGNKHDERIVVTHIVPAHTPPHEDPPDPYASGPGPAPIVLEGVAYESAVGGWATAIDTFEADGYQGNDVAEYAESGQRSRWKALERGQTLFVSEVSGTVHLLPGMITRQRYPSLPSELLPDHLRPCSAWKEMSVSERLFGWAKDGGKTEPGERTAYRGQCRFEPARCETDKAIKPDDSERYWVLAALNGPKPAQARFYLRDKDGKPLTGMAKKDGYQREHRLAGHKVYPTHRGQPQGYWNLPTASSTIVDGKTTDAPTQVGGRYRSWLAPPGTSVKLATAIGDWVKAGAEFVTTVHFDNLRREELGALLWALDLGSRSVADPPACVKLGKGRPLGFGAVRMHVDRAASVVRDFDGVRSRYTSLQGGATTAGESAALLQQVVQEFEAWLESTAPGIMTAIIEAAKGWTDPIIYPRVGVGNTAGEPPPALETYEWFVQNERRRTPRALPTMDNGSPRLPYLAPEATRQRRRGR